MLSSLFLLHLLVYLQLGNGKFIISCTPCSNWRERPLPQRCLDYAADDVRFLLPVAQRMGALDDPTALYLSQILADGHQMERLRVQRPAPAVAAVLRAVAMSRALQHSSDTDDTAESTEVAQQAAPPAAVSAHAATQPAVAPGSSSCTQALDVQQGMSQNQQPPYRSVRVQLGAGRHAQAASYTDSASSLLQPNNTAAAEAAPAADTESAHATSHCLDAAAQQVLQVLAPW